MRLHHAEHRSTRAGSRFATTRGSGRAVLASTVTARLLGAAASAALLAACGAGDRAAAGPVVRDSAGIAIVENHAPRWTEAAAWRVAAAPAVTIGVAEGGDAYQLFNVRNAVRLSDGRIVVANGGTHELRFYDAGGRHLRSVGGQGSGPGEFLFMLDVLRLAGDSLLVGDAFARRVSAFGPDGEFVRTHAVPAPLGRLADGTLLRRVSGRDEDPPEEGRSRGTGYLVAYGFEGDATDTVFRLPDLERYHTTVRSSGRQTIVMRPIPFARVARVTVAGEHIYSGNGESYEIRVRTGAGRLRRLIRRMVPNPPVSQADIDAFRERLLGNAEDENVRRDQERYLAVVGFPETLPAFDALRVDATGHLWVREYQAAAAGNRWDIFDPEGRWLGTVALPAGLEVDEIGADYVLGRVTGALGVTRVRLHRLEKPPVRVSEGDRAPRRPATPSTASNESAAVSRAPRMRARALRSTAPGAPASPRRPARN